MRQREIDVEGTMTDEVNDLPIVDVHAHWLPPSLLAACRRGTEWQDMQMSMTSDGRPAGSINGQTKTYGASLHFGGLAARVSSLDGDGVDKQVLSLLPPLFRYDRDEADAVIDCQQINDELAADLDEAPSNRYLGLGVAPLQAIPAAVADTPCS